MLPLVRDPDRSIYVRQEMDSLILGMYEKVGKQWFPEGVPWDYAQTELPEDVDNVAEKARAYGVPGVIVDGNDVLAVRDATAEAAERAKSGGGPTLIECKTYRWYDHYGTRGAQIGVDGAFGLGYRSDRELKDWMAKDPIERFRRFLVREGVISTKRADEIVKSAYAPFYDAAVEDGTLNSWGWLAHHTGGKWRRLLYYTAHGLEALIDAPDAIREKIAEAHPIAAVRSPSSASEALAVKATETP